VAVILVTGDVLVINILVPVLTSSYDDGLLYHNYTDKKTLF
jgi:hypothetical protein